MGTAGQSEEQQKPQLRSARWFRKNDLPGFIHRSTLAADGWTREDLMEKPIVGILNTWSDISPCNLNLRSLAQKVREGILEAGGIPFELPLMSISENLIKPSSFPFRNMLAMDTEETIRGYPLDAVVLMGGCDKTQPGLLMGAASANVPAIVLNSGPGTPRSATGEYWVTGSPTTTWSTTLCFALPTVGAGHFARPMLPRSMRPCRPGARTRM